MPGTTTTTTAMLLLPLLPVTTATTTAITTTTGNNNNNGGDQSSLTLDPQLVQTGFEQDGQGADADPGQVASATSNNNFINYCGTTNLPLTNGTQIKTGSCNAAPMGMIAATTAMPSSKFVNPKNLDTVPANQNITIQMAISNLDTGNFVNPNTNYFSAPQQTSSSGVIQGHSHVVVEAIDSLTSTATTDPTKFAFFQGFNDAAQNGILSATIAGGLPEGVYKMSSINSAANHQPVLVAVAQHGSLDDAVYFTVSNNGGGNNNAGGNNNNAGGTTTTPAATTTMPAAMVMRLPLPLRPLPLRLQQRRRTTVARATLVPVLLARRVVLLPARRVLQPPVLARRVVLQARRQVRQQALLVQRLAPLVRRASGGSGNERPPSCRDSCPS
ncbi:uncharacterized protein B0H18DRAFT_521462 [Fomitopsis serialis]|uniref:uncharacterized protein n=1 Tax=Fomitopsis serialis TaxID=139415 RepID=UPI002007525F|nr:uncharacterized protein B0H18DRAFT_521462 [Neoantrodia serialis]KAH9922169.1 hypothetical protein B0H18DRAFT_521462 [Neoantrodia serialis]